MGFVQLSYGAVSDDHDLRRLERSGPGGTQLRVEDWHLAKEIIGLHERHHRLSTVDGAVRDGDPAADDDVEPVGLITLLEQDVAPTQITELRRRSNRCNVFGFEPSEEVRRRDETRVHHELPTLVWAMLHGWLCRRPAACEVEVVGTPGDRDDVSMNDLRPVVWTILVAAGSGSRFGADKLAQTLGGDSTVLDRSLAVATSVSDGVVLVVGAHDSALEREHVQGIHCVAGGRHAQRIGSKRSRCGTSERRCDLGS